MATTKTGAEYSEQIPDKGKLPPRAICVTKATPSEFGLGLKVTRIDDLGLQDNSDIELLALCYDSMHSIG